MSTDLESSGVDVNDPKTTRFDLVREGARRDGVEIVVYEPRFPVPGTKRERRVVRSIALMFGISSLSALLFVIAYIAWPWKYKDGSGADKLYTPILGVTLGLTMLGLAFGAIAWAKKLLPHEVSVEGRHATRSDPVERKLTGATVANMGDELGVQRRPLLKLALGAGLLPIGALAAAPLIGGLIKDPHHPDALFHTGWDPRNNNGQPIRLVREDMSPIRPEDVSIGGQITVFPGIPNGTTNEYGDSPTLLIHLRAEDAAKLRGNLNHVPENKANMLGNLVAYSKICTHAGCPASLYQQQDNVLLCPCHQSQFNILDNARPIFGPATRRLPMLPLDIDSDGYLVAKSDYQVAVGPGFWERP
jgi:ubiquinol-cytochrome c reductase iron-sulfur subunit